MRHKKVKLSMILLISFGLTELNAQEVVTASGGNASGSGGSTSYTVGQVIYTTNTNSNGSINQGVQFPFEISIISRIEEDININLSYQVYPNPTTKNLTLRIDELKGKHYRAILFNINGKVLSEQIVTTTETRISMEQYGTETYFLKIIELPSREVKTFKLIKK
jgi:hypothetical protein